RSDIHVFLDAATGLRKQRAEADNGRRRTIVDDSREKRSSHVLADETGHKRERLARTLERTVAAHHAAPYRVRQQRRRDRHRGERAGTQLEEVACREAHGEY